MSLRRGIETNLTMGLPLTGFSPLASGLPEWVTSLTTSDRTREPLFLGGRLEQEGVDGCRIVSVSTPP